MSPDEHLSQSTPPHDACLPRQQSPTTPPASPTNVWRLPRYLVKWLLLAGPLGIVTGSACALFLWALDHVTTLRWEHPWLPYLLPVIGVLVGVMYHRLGKDVEAGSNLLLDEIHSPGGGVPARIVPLVFVGTILTHLCGGSAGREGTAVQMGGGLASALARSLGFLCPPDTRVLLMAGVAGGFGGVFGTPLAGAIFALEVLTIGRLHSGAIVPCLIAALASDYACTAWGIIHTPYHIQLAAQGPVWMEWALLAKVCLAGAAFGLVARFFSWFAHAAQGVFRTLAPAASLRPAIGGVGVIGLAWLFGTDALGIGVISPDPAAVTIVSSFREGGAHAWSWLLKIVFTVMTLSSGFKGGEVTPLFYIGASLGSVLSQPLGAPTDLMAGLGLVAVFGAAANTPLACTVMAVELFGAGAGAPIVYYACACYLAYFCAGQSGIYSSQRRAASKVDHTAP